MVRKTAEELTTYLREQVGGGLRTVVIIHGEGHEMHYLRDDLRAEYAKSTFTAVVEAFRLEDAFKNPGIEGTPVGERRAEIQVHENAVVLQFPYSESESILISLGPEVGHDLLQFIGQCRTIVHEE